MKAKEQKKARSLRQNQGLSIKEIAKKVGVSKSSISLWVRNIQLSNRQKERLHKRNVLFFNQEYGNKIKSAKCRAVRQAYQEHGKSLAKRKEFLHAMGCMLYWCEGAKDRNKFQFTNSDPKMMVLFMKFMKRYFNISSKDVTIHVLYHKLNSKSTVKA